MSLLGCRIGDVYPDNMVKVSVRMYLYRWNEHTEDDPGNAHYQASSKKFCKHITFGS